MEKLTMSWTKETEKKWKAFENAVLSRDKNQFKLYCEYIASLKSQKQEEKEDELVF